MSRYFGTSARLWQNLQAQYDLEIARRKTGKRVERSSSNERQMPLLGGFQEMAESGPVAGTSADDTLNHDIRLLLWRNESLHHWDCGHEVLGASAFDPQTSKELAALPAEQRQLVEAGLTRGEPQAEQWQIKSCDTTTSYLVMMGKSPKGGTDVMAVPLGAASSP